MSDENCHQCESYLVTPVICSSCHVLQTKAREQDYFSLFGLEPSVAVDLERLNKIYLELSRHVHPDFNLNQGNAASDLSSYINEGYRVLSHRLYRYEYLNQLWGGKTPTEDKTTDKDFLISMLELQEEVAACQNEQQLADYAKCARKSVETILDEVADHLEKRELDQVRQKLNQVSYYHTLIEYTRGSKQI